MLRLALALGLLAVAADAASAADTPSARHAVTQAMVESQMTSEARDYSKQWERRLIAIQMRFAASLAKSATSIDAVQTGPITP